MTGLADSAPLVGERLDEPPPSRRGRGLFGPAGSFAFHVLVALALLFSWHTTPPVETPPIPVSLVILPPPPSPKTKPSAPSALPRASDSYGNPEAKTPEASPPAETAAPPPPAETAAPAERPAPSPAETAAPVAAAATPPPPVKPAAPEAKPAPTPARHPPLKHAAARSLGLPGKYPGPAATRDEYLAYCVALTRQHLDLLPRSYVGNRSGQTVLEIHVLDSGAIGLIRVSRSSGYPDIDRRVEQMVAAVKRFPPLPQWFQGSEITLRFSLEFPGALLE